MLHTQFYKDAMSRLEMIIPAIGKVSDNSMKLMGVMHEEALNQLERGYLRLDEFNSLRSKMRSAGMTEMFY